MVGNLIWCDVCNPKDRGGVGISSSLMKNKALINKWFWRCVIDAKDVNHAANTSRLNTLFSRIQSCGAPFRLGEETCHGSKDRIIWKGTTTDEYTTSCHARILSHFFLLLS
ncbi:hypothetical protein ES332_D12G266200v1 [Gossypium tomentosum]|uniref:Reverse transcriptase zinc-binding domain-containing protein n=1 Tax=Gossypium tomentosum TaxID=34277 RepID=A0A5D2IE73_GOSTO|nr:hypothetical protein ES332_D12G266200v1 [Gossypium tomentosum]